MKERIRSQRSGKKSPCRASNAAASITRLVAQVNFLYLSSLSRRTLFRWLVTFEPISVTCWHWSRNSHHCLASSRAEGDGDGKIGFHFVRYARCGFDFCDFLRKRAMMITGRSLSLCAVDSSAARSMEQTARCNSQSIIRALLLDASIEFLTSILTLYFSIRALFLRLKRKLAFLSHKQEREQRAKKNTRANVMKHLLFFLPFFLILSSGRRIEIEPQIVSK